MNKILFILSFVVFLLFSSCGKQTVVQEEPISETPVSQEQEDDVIGELGTVDEDGNLDAVSPGALYQECLSVVAGNTESDLLAETAFYKNYMHGVDPSFQKTMGDIFESVLVQQDCSSLGENMPICNAYLDNNLDSVSENPFVYYTFKSISTGENLCSNIEGAGLQGDCTSNFILGMNIKENKGFDSEKYEKQISEVFLSACQK